MHFLKTKNDYHLDEVMSALQKSIRRGKEKEAFLLGCGDVSYI